jgi:polysaccharide biosynthesis protein PelC
MSGFNQFGRVVSWCAAAAATVAVLGACTTVRETAAPSIASGDSIAVASISNYTETPDAGRSAETIAANVLRTNGIADVRLAPADVSSNSMFDSAQRGNTEKKLEWARSQHVRYVLTGAVEEWRYKVGVDGEPVVGVTFELLDTASGHVVWSSTGSKSGWSRSGLTSVAQSLIGRVLAPIAATRS